MLFKKMYWPLAILVILTLALGACTPAEDGDGDTGMQIPDIEEGMFNVALVMLSTHDDGGR